MRSEFTTLSTIAEITMGQSPPKTKVSKNSDTAGLPLLNGPTEFGTYHPFPTQFTSVSKKIAKSGDLLFCVRGSTTGRMNWADQDYAIGRGIASIRSKVSNDYQPLIRAFVEHALPKLLAAATGSVFPNVTKSMLHDLPCPIISEAEQKRIAALLSSLDDLIELNREMNQILEEMAQAIFKSWFIDFDGVPEEDLVESELGLIPRGWEVKTIGDIIDRQKVGKKYNQKTVEATGAVPVLDQGKSGIIGYHNDKPGVIASLEKPIAVFANHTCLMRLVTFSFSTIQNVLPFYGYGVDTIWAFYATLGKQSFNEYKGHWPDFIIHKIPVPDYEKTFIFGETIRPLIEHKYSNEKQSQILSELRDTLLPKLISGELRIPEAEKMVEDVL